MDKVHVVYIFLDSACNFRCKYCYQRLDGYTNYKDMPMSATVIDKVVEFIEYIMKNKCNIFKDDVLNIMFYGGEPMLHMDKIEYIVKKLKQYTIGNGKIFFNIITNGYNINEYIERLVNLNILANKHVKLRVSYDFWYQNTERRADTYNVVRKNMLEAMENDIAVSTITTITTKNYVNIDEMMYDFLDFYKEVYKKNLFHVYDYSVIVTNKRPDDNTDYETIDRSEYVKAFEDYFQTIMDFENDFFNRVDDKSYARKFNSFLFRENDHKPVQNNELTSRIYSILPNGDATLLSGKKDVICNITDISCEEYYNLVDEKLLNYKSPEDIAICMKCEYNSYCDGNNWNTVDGTSCKISKFLGSIIKEAKSNVGFDE